MLKITRIGNYSLEKYSSKTKLIFFNRKKNPKSFSLLSLCFLCVSLQLCGQIDCCTLHTVPWGFPFFGQHQDSLLPSVSLSLLGVNHNE